MDGRSSDRGSLCAVAIMAKESVPGRCKTRLVPPLAAIEAAAANTAFLRDIAGNIEAACASAPIQGVAAYHPPGSEAFFEDLMPEGFLLLPPREPGIGRSLFHAARDLLGMGFGSACLVNADSPTLPTRFLVEAARLLGLPGVRVVFGPSVDGGYYLIGLKGFHARLFEDIAWSTESVLAQSLERAAEIGLQVALLPEWYDVDDAACLLRLTRELSGAGDESEAGYPAPSTRAWLRLPPPADRLPASSFLGRPA